MKLEFETNKKTGKKPFTGPYVERELASLLKHSGDYIQPGTVVSAPVDFWEKYEDLAVTPPTAEDVEDLEAKAMAAAARLESAKAEKARLEKLNDKAAANSTKEK